MWLVHFGGQWPENCITWLLDRVVLNSISAWYETPASAGCSWLARLWLLGSVNICVVSIELFDEYPSLLLPQLQSYCRRYHELTSKMDLQKYTTVSSPAVSFLFVGGEFGKFLKTTQNLMLKHWFHEFRIWVYVMGDGCHAILCIFIQYTKIATKLKSKSDYFYEVRFTLWIWCRQTTSNVIEPLYQHWIGQ